MTNPELEVEALPAPTENASLDRATIDQLNSAETRALLDTIDAIHELQVGDMVDLPQIIVVGDQSAGKSSVLEAISRVRFPVESGLSEWADAGSEPHLSSTGPSSLSDQKSHQPASPYLSITRHKREHNHYKMDVTRGTTLDLNDRYVRHLRSSARRPKPAPETSVTVSNPFERATPSPEEVRSIPVPKRGSPAPKTPAIAPVAQTERRRTPDREVRSSHVLAPGKLNGIRIDALPDSGADNCCIDLTFARQSNLEILPTNKKRIVLGSGKTISPVGEVRADWTFRGEREAHPLVLYVLNTLAATDVALGNPFLKATKTFTEHKSRISRTTSALSRKLFRLMLLGGGTDRIRGYLDDQEVHALPDTGAEIMAMSTAMALRHNYKIDSSEENRIEVQFADGSTKRARGLVHSLKWGFGPGSKPANSNLDGPDVTRARCDFYVFDGLPVDVILSADFVLDFDVFSPKYEACFVEDRGPANEMFCNIRVVKKWLKNISQMRTKRCGGIPGGRDSTNVANILPDAFPPHVVMREGKRRNDIVAANWPGMDQAAIDREKDYWRAWDAAKDHYWSGRHSPQQLVRPGGSPDRDGIQSSSDGEMSGLSILASPG